MVMLGIGIPSVAAQSNSLQYNHSAGIVTLSTDNIEIRVTGANQAPHFHWWDPNNESVDYHMRFVSLFEINDTDDDGVFTRHVDSVIGPRFMLPTAGWEFSGFLTETEDDEVTAVHFNFTTTTEYDPRPGGPMGDYGHLPDKTEFDVMAQIRIHMDMANPSQVKFDVIIDGWEWTYDDSSLVMQFTICESNHGQGQPDEHPRGFQRDGTKFNFSAAFMEYEEKAFAAQNELQVGASYGEGVGLEAGESVYLTFENFGDETLVYDPILGIASDSSVSSIDNTLLLIIAGVAVVALIAIALKVRK